MQCHYVQTVTLYKRLYSKAVIKCTVLLSLCVVAILISTPGPPSPEIPLKGLMCPRVAPQKVVFAGLRGGAEALVRLADRKLSLFKGANLLSQPPAAGGWAGPGCVRACTPS